MREGIHPSYVESTVTCACGNTFKTRSTKSIIRLDICSACHPFFTGRQKFVDSAGRVERFQKRFAKAAGEPVKKPKPAAVVKGQPKAKKKVKVLSSTPVKTKPAADKAAGSKSPATKPSAPAKAH